MGSRWYYFVRWLATQVFRLTGGLRSVGEENVPREGATILAPVHTSFLDPPAVACGTRRQLRFMAKESLFRVPLLGPAIRSLGAYPVRRGESDTESIRRTIALLEQGNAVLIFPEGTRGDGRSLLPINKGVTMLAKRTNALVVPVAVVGTHHVLPRSGKRSRHLVTLAYGEPFRYADLGDRDAFARELARRLLALSAANGMPLEPPGEGDA